MATVFDTLLQRLSASGDHNANELAAPAVILWPDKECQWEALASRLRAALPQFLALGAYEPSAKTGPAIWLRCLIARTLPEADWPAGETPIIYLPGVSRQDLRAVENCPKALQPLAELQYRGVIWSHPNGRDWTVAGFLQTPEGGLGLDVAPDAATKEALLRALTKLADADVAELRGRRIDGSFIDDLVHPDVARDLLGWMHDPDGTRARWDSNAWDAFRSICREKFGFDPESDGLLVAADKLGTQDNHWRSLWHRYAEAPAAYPAIAEALRRARPTPTPGDMFYTRGAWPQDNEEGEDALRSALADLSTRAPADARTAVLTHEKAHAERRTWVWARLGHAPLAAALEHLAALAQATAHGVTGATPADMATSYVAGGWRADAAVLDALAAVEKAMDIAAVKAVVEVVYTPWLEDAANRLQDLLRDRHPLAGPSADGELRHGTCVLFADGLRYDVGQKLLAALESSPVSASGTWSFAALPTVTATAKPAVSPVAADLAFSTDAAEFLPALSGSGKPLTADAFRKLLAARGIQVLGADATGDPAGMAWTECGSLDKAGHNDQARLANRIAAEVSILAERIRALLLAGWGEVRVVTDHGWLLVPGGLPKTDLPAYLVESRWGRCAALKQTSSVDLLTVAWRWNTEIPVAMAPGISNFFAGNEYAHGGISLQECVVPIITVRASCGQGPVATIEKITWVGLRCKVQVAGGAGLLVDLRTRAADPASSIVATPKAANQDGAVSLPVEKDHLAGTSVFVVVLGCDGAPIAKAQTVVGGA